MRPISPQAKATLPTSVTLDPIKRAKSKPQLWEYLRFWEYTFVLAFISVVAIAVELQLHRNVTSVFEPINSQLQTAYMCH